jgi:hypothetical protein
MKLSDFYKNPLIIEAFGRSRVYETIRHLKSVWPGFLPEYSERFSSYHAAWLLLVLCQNKVASRASVIGAIRKGKELKCDGQHFTTWLGDILNSYDKIEAEIKSIYIFYEGDLCAHVFTEANDLKSGYIKVFQTETKVSQFRRAAIMDKSFVMEISAMIDILSIDNDNSEDEQVFEYNEKLHPSPSDKTFE